MNKKYLLSALMGVAAVAFTGCIEENFEKVTPAQDGDEIIFGVRAGFENSNPSTRTEYSGDTYTVGDGENAKTFERIDWVDGTDMIQIYCPEATNGGEGNTAHYRINDASTPDDDDDNTKDKKDEAFLTRIGDSSLQWNGDGEHNFYAMYPSSNLFDDDITIAQGVKLNKTVLNGIVPDTQNPVRIVEDENGNYIAVPDMRYAYMAAKSVAVPSQGKVSLTFVPIVTAVQIELQMPTSVSSGSGQVVPTTIAEIKVEGSGIAGAFTADLSEDAWKDTYPVCENAAEGSGSILISVWRDDKPLTIEAGETLTFTVFLRPGADVKDLKVLISPNGAGYVGQNIDDIIFPAMKKTTLDNLCLPATALEIDASNWMAQLSEDTPLKKLSIPGTGGSFSYNYTSSNPDWYKQQTLTFEDQWAAGIRAFEIVSNRPYEEPADAESATSLGAEYVKCNKVSMGVTVETVLKDLLKKVSEAPKGKSEASECAVLILTYQPEGGTGGATNSGNRNGLYYARNLRKMYNGLTDDQKKKIIQYKPDLTLKDAKGKVMIFCRINQKDESDNGDTADKTAFELATETLAGTNITLIDGCGTGKDRWGSRGYTVKGTDESGNVIWNVAYDAANITDATKSVDYYLRKPYSGSFADWNNVRKPSGNLNFGYGTNFDNVTCWYQEWARVVPASLIDSSLGYFYGDIQASFTDWFPTDYRWYESYTEKLAAAEETFKMAISDTYPSYVFINSLCGYLVDPSIESSYTIFTGSNTGGIAGNIKGLADKLNPAFYQYVLGAGMEQTTGPTGIVMMDYVTNEPNTAVDYDGSYLLPGVIISNNFKFD